MKTKQKIPFFLGKISDEDVSMELKRIGNNYRKKGGPRKLSKG